VRKPSDRLYVIGNAGVQTVKIGITNDVERRLSELRTTACPYAVESSALAALAVYEVPNARSLELTLHARFAAVRLRGACGPSEWFRFGAGALFLIDGAVSQFLGREAAA